MANSKALKLLITGDVSSAKKALAQLDSSMGKTGKASDSLGSQIKRGLGGLGLGAAIFGSLSAANESLKVAHQTEAVIKSTGGAANVTAAHIGDMATSISNATGMDDEMIQSGENMLATFKQIRNEAGKGNDIFDQATQVMVDFAAATGTDAKDAAVTLGKALNDPTTGLTALRRVGVTFTAQQKEQIKTMQASGDVMGAQKMILKELTSEFGGSAAAQASSLDKIHTQLGNVAETIGTDLMPAVDVAAKGATVLSTVLGQLPGPVVTLGTVVVGGAAAWTIFGSTVIGTVGTLGNMIGVLATYTPSAIVARGATAGLAEAFAVEAAAAEGAAGSTAVAGAAAKGGAGGMAGMLGKATLLAGALYGVGAGANWIGDKFADAVPNVEDMSTALVHLARSGDEAGAVAKAGGIDKLTDRMRRFKDETKGVNNVANKAVEGIIKFGTIGKATTGMDRLTAQINAYDKSLAAMVSGGKGKEAAADFKLIQAQAKKAGLSTKDVNRFMNDYVKAVADAKLKNADAKGAADGLSGSLAKQKAKTDKAKQAMNDLTSALKAYSDQTTSLLSANISWEASLDTVTSTLQTNGNQWDINTEAGRNNMNALIGAKDAAIDNANAMLTNGSSVDQVTSSMSLFRGQLENTLSQAGLTKDQIKFLIDQMGLTPSQIHTTITSNLPDAQRQAQNYLDALNALPTTKRIAVEEVFSGSSSFFGHAPGQWWGGDLPGHAWGGSPAGWAMVGEHGPELTNGKTVIGAGRTQSLLSRMPSAPVAVSGGNTYVTIQVQVSRLSSVSVMGMLFLRAITC